MMQSQSPGTSTTPKLVRSVALDPYRRHFGAERRFAALLAELGLPARSGDPHGVIPLLSLLELQERSAELAGDPALGARIGSRNTPADLGVPGLLLQQSSTPRRGLTRYAASVSALQGDTLMRLVSEGRLIGFSYQLRGIDLRLWPQDAELSLASTCQLIRSCFDPRWNPLEVQFAHPPSPRAKQLEALFGASVTFGQSASRILFDAARFDLSYRAEDPALVRLLEHYVAEQSLSTAHTGPFSEQVDSAIARLLGQHRCTLAAIAAEFGMTTRALQRRLAAEGTTLRELQRAHRIRVAERQLETPGVPLSEIAQAVGYSDNTVFWRAWRNWTGSAPSSRKRKG